MNSVLCRPMPISTKRSKSQSKIWLQAANKIRFEIRQIFNCCIFRKSTFLQSRPFWARGCPILTQLPLRASKHIYRTSVRFRTMGCRGYGAPECSCRSRRNTCVFCAQDLSGSPVIAHYRAFFSEAYRAHQQTIRNAESNFNQTHSADAALPFERSVSTLKERRRFWSEFGELPEIIIDSLRLQPIGMQFARRSRNFSSKRKQPHLMPSLFRMKPDRRSMPITLRRSEIAAVNQQISLRTRQSPQSSNEPPQRILHRLAATLARLKATKARHMPATDALCQSYLTEKQAKASNRTAAGSSPPGS